MSFGVRDQDWIDPPEPPTFRATCRDCNHCHECPCGEHGFCEEIGEFVELDAVITVGSDCDEFDAAAGFDSGWEEADRGDYLYDLMRDRQLEEE